MKIFRAEPAHWHRLCDVKIGLVDSLFVKRERQEPGFNRRMFDEDFARLFDSMNRRSGNLFEIASNDDELIQKLLGNVKTRYAPHPVDETIRGFVEEIYLTRSHLRILGTIENWVLGAFLPAR